MTPPRPIGEPFSLVAGDTLQFDRDFPNFPASDGWALSYTLGGQGLTNITDIAGANITSTGSTFHINVPAATTGKWSAGEYSWIAVVTGSGAFAGQRFTVATGQVEVKQNPSSENAEIDTRSQAQKNFDAIEAVIAERCGNDVQQYRVGHGITGREFTKLTLEELYTARSFWEQKIKLERIQAGEQQRTTTVGAYFGMVR